MTMEPVAKGSVRFRGLRTGRYSLFSFFSGRILQALRICEERRVGAAFVLTSVLIGLVPILSCLLCSPDRFWPPQGQVHYVCLLRDLNVLVAFVVFLPVLVALLVAEDRLLPSRLTQLVETGVLVVGPNDEAKFCRRWTGWFGSANIAGQLLGVMIGVAMAVQRYADIIGGKEGWQITEPGGAIVSWCFAGVWFVLVQVPLVSIALSVFLCRALTTALVLFDVAKHFELHVRPFDADNAGGLSPVAVFSLRNQYVLAAAGLQMALLVDVSAQLDGAANLGPTIVALSVIFLTTGPVIFVLPLLPFRQVMMVQRRKALAHVGEAMQSVIDGVLASAPSRGISREESEAVERLMELRRTLRRMPVWPFDVETVRRFFLAYVTPVVAFLTQPLWGQTVKLLLPSP